MFTICCLRHHAVCSAIKKLQTVDIWYIIWYMIHTKWYVIRYDMLWNIWYDIYVMIEHEMMYVMVLWNVICYYVMIYDIWEMIWWYMMWYDTPNPDANANTPAAGPPKKWRTLQRSVMKSFTLGSRSGVIDSRQEIVPSFSQAVTVPQGSTTWKQQKFQTSLQYQGNNHGKVGAMLFR